MGGTHFLQTGYLLLNRNAPFSFINVNCIWKPENKKSEWSILLYSDEYCRYLYFFNNDLPLFFNITFNKMLNKERLFL